MKRGTLTWYMEMLMGNSWKVGRMEWRIDRSNYERIFSHAGIKVSCSIFMIHDRNEPVAAAIAGCDGPFHHSRGYAQFVDTVGAVTIDPGEPM